ILPALIEALEIRRDLARPGQPLVVLVDLLFDVVEVVDRFALTRVEAFDQSLPLSSPLLEGFAPPPSIHQPTIDGAGRNGRKVEQLTDQRGDERDERLRIGSGDGETG